MEETGARERLLTVALHLLAAERAEESAHKADRIEYLDNELALAARDLKEATDALPPDRQPIGWRPSVSTNPFSERFVQALSSGEDAVIPVGDTVLCDICDEDFTDSARSGGFMFQSKAVGPCCASRVEASVIGYGEVRFVRGRCPQGVPFADWVRGMRGPGAAIRVTHGISGIPRPEGGGPQ